MSALDHLQRFESVQFDYTCRRTTACRAMRRRRRAP